MPPLLINVNSYLLKTVTSGNSNAGWVTLVFESSYIFMIHLLIIYDSLIHAQLSTEDIKFMGSLQL